MIDAQQVWPLFLSEARAYEVTGEEYFSPSRGGSYRITGTSNDVIRISRVNVPGSGETISIRKFGTAISRINDQNATFPRGRIYEHVAEEVTMVELLSFLDWSESGRNIVNAHSRVERVYDENNDEALNDNPDSKVTVSVRQRKGQRKFREKLLQVYQGHCAFSDCSVREVLHACHIDPHSRSGINLSSNGLILRADLHDLFDQNLIAITPNSHCVRVSSRLINSDYYLLNSKTLRRRSDGRSLDENALVQRWENFIN